MYQVCISWGSIIGEREKDRAHVHREFAPVMVTEKCEDRRVLPQEG